MAHMFVDHIRIHARAGNGGDGSASFRREKYIPRGGPDGGDGGRGGSIILKVDHHTDNLKQFFYDSMLKAGHGGKGAGRLKSGRSGDDKYFRVPQGTLVYREKTPEVMEGAEGDDFLVDDEAPATKKRSLKEQLAAGDELELIADLTDAPRKTLYGRALELKDGA